MIIRAVVFDLGKVLIDFSYTEFFALLRRHGARIDSIEDFAVKVRLADYEHGRITCSDFIAGINALLTDPLSEPEMQLAWNGLFSPIPAMLDFAVRLKNHCPVYLLSNIGRIHWEFLHPAYRLADYYHDALPSFEVEAMKPSPVIYRAAQERFGLLPENTLFIDDREENIVGAEACGWHGIHHQCVQATQEHVSELTGFAR